MNKLQFSESIKEGKWFQYKKNDHLHAMKITSQENGKIHFLTLSFSNPGSIGVYEAAPNHWDYLDGHIETKALIGSPLGFKDGLFAEKAKEAQLYIYDADGNVIKDKLVDALLEISQGVIVYTEELELMWDNLKSNKINHLEMIHYNNYEN
ncbi:hypothetical protein [Bacillus bombysepticus]|uniref:hypothetical protein n=1 Tax=Bacillus bombysepticus TaxID=658666 RepID=UPI00301B0E3F